MPRLTTPARIAAFAATLTLTACAPLASLPFDTRPVTVDAPLDRTTRARLAAATASLPACQAWLSGAGVNFTALADRQEAANCSVTASGRLADATGGLPQLAPRRPMMACSLAAAYVLWQRQVVGPAARDIFGSDVVTIDHLGAYACRPVNGQLGQRPSAHASARAIDVAGFRLRDGRRISVARDWHGAPDRAQFLRRVRDGACQTFGTTLSPDYNTLHADHLHLEDGASGLCR